MTYPHKGAAALKSLSQSLLINWKFFFSVSQLTKISILLPQAVKTCTMAFVQSHLKGKSKALDCTAHFFFTLLCRFYAAGQNSARVYSPFFVTVIELSSLTRVRSNQGGLSTGQTAQIQLTVHPVYLTLVCCGLVGR